MTITFAHLQDQGINFAVFQADAVARTAGARSEILAKLTRAARAQGLLVQKSALCFREGGAIKFYGTPDLVKYLSRGGVPRWTHKLTIAEPIPEYAGEESQGYW